MPLFYSSAPSGNIESFCNSWVEDVYFDISGIPEILLGDKIYFFNSNKNLFFDACFDPEYCLCCEIFAQERHVGYAFFGLNTAIGVQISSACVFIEDCHPDTKFGFYFPSPGSRQLRDPVSGTKYDINRSAGYAFKAPPQRYFGDFDDDEVCAALISASPDKAISLLGNFLGPSVSSDDIETLNITWKTGTARRRLKLLCQLYESSHFYRVGESQSISTPNTDFPTDEYVLAHPKDKKAEFDFNNELHRLSATSIINHMTYFSKFFAISQNQRKKMEVALIELGPATKLRAPYPTVDEVWLGSTESGKTVICSGAVDVSESRISFVNVVGGCQLGDVIFRDGERFGRFDGELWKVLNHNYFIDPERQRGIGVSISRRSV